MNQNKIVLSIEESETINKKWIDSNLNLRYNFINKTNNVAQKYDNFVVMSSRLFCSFTLGYS